ncbi:MAG: WS/DGAT domain-containing protein [Acidimicrobiales bacterium]|jgi:WS/DGAT/MGAT family acyltransferase|nr:WS/DGAT domain-containing protein [Acidimicrobiales bacterium]
MAGLDDIAQFEFTPRMSDADALMWNIEKDPLLRSTITTVMIFDRSPDRARFRARMDRVSRLVPRLRQRVLHRPLSIAPPRWEIDRNFDLDYHLRWTRALGDGTLREVFDIAQPIAMQGFDRARPLWEFTLVDGLVDGRAALIAKIHHSITDGVGGMKLQLEMLDLEREPGDEAPLPAEPRSRELSEARRWLDAAFYEGQRQVESTRGTMASATDSVERFLHDPVGVGVDAVRTGVSVAKLLSPATQPLSPLMRGRSLSVRFYHLQADLGALKAAARLVGGKLNDAFVAAVAGGLRRYHEHYGYHVDQLRMTMPINVRGEATSKRAGNQFVPARFPVPVGIDDPLRRMNAVRELVERQRVEPALSLSDPLANILNRFPATVTTAVFGSMLKGVDFVTSNVPGPPVPVHLAGARLESQIAFGPLSGAATNVTLLSYLGDLDIGINLDPAAIPDGDLFYDCMAEGFAEITAVV